MNEYQRALNDVKNAKILLHIHDDIVDELNVFDEEDIRIEILQELVDKYEKIKKALNKAISERINETGKVLEREEISYIQALQFVLKLLDRSNE